MNIYLFRTEDIEHHVVVAANEEDARKLVVDHLIMLWGEDEAATLIAGLSLALVSTTDEGYLWTYYSESDEDNKKVQDFGLSHNHPGCIPYA
jgi:hypothetical protein